jgi:hypothetical protein
MNLNSSLHHYSAQKWNVFFILIPRARIFLMSLIRKLDMYFRRTVRKNRYSQRQVGRALCPIKRYKRQPNIKSWCTSTIFLPQVQNPSNHIHWMLTSHNNEVTHTGGHTLYLCLYICSQRHTPLSGQWRIISVSSAWESASIHVKSGATYVWKEDTW